MEKYFLYNNIILKKRNFHTGKNILKKRIDYKNKTIVQVKNNQRNKRSTFYHPLIKNYSDLALTYRQQDEENFPFISKINNNQNDQFESLINNRINNNKSNHYNNELYKNKSFINNNNFKNKINESIQSDLCYDEEIENHKNDNSNFNSHMISNMNSNMNSKTNFKSESIIDYLLNKRLKINLPKIKKVNIGKKNLIEKLKSLYGKGIFLDRYEKQYLQKIKPVQHYFKNNNNKLLNLIDKKSIFMKKSKSNSSLNNKSVYKTVEYGNRKEKVATKIIIDENENKDDNNIDCHFLMKYPIKYFHNSYYNSYDSNINNILSNFSSSLKSKIKVKTDKYKDNKISNNNFKILSEKGFEMMKRNKSRGYIKNINKTIEEINLNRKQYNSLAEINFKIFNKNKNEVLSKDLL